MVEGPELFEDLIEGMDLLFFGDEVGSKKMIEVTFLLDIDEGEPPQDIDYVVGGRADLSASQDLRKEQDIF